MKVIQIVGARERSSRLSGWWFITIRNSATAFPTAEPVDQLVDRLEARRELTPTVVHKDPVVVPWSVQLNVAVQNLDLGSHLRVEHHADLGHYDHGP